MSEPDVVDAMSALLDLWDEAVASGREANAPAIRSLLGEARDEIVGLRTALMTSRARELGTALDKQAIRGEALEEAARKCLAVSEDPETTGDGKSHCVQCAWAIRALKGGR